MITIEVSDYLLDTPSFMKTTKTINARFWGWRVILYWGRVEIEKRFFQTDFWILITDKLSRECIFQIFYSAFHFVTKRVFRSRMLAINTWFENPPNTSAFASFSEEFRCEKKIARIYSLDFGHIFALMCSFLLSCFFSGYLPRYKQKMDIFVVWS